MSVGIQLALVLASITTILFHGVDGFFTPLPSKADVPAFVSRALQPSLMVQPKVPVLYMSSLFGAVVDVGNKYYQLEEMEDKERCITEIFLSTDKTITFGETDGPLPVRSEGTWEHNSKRDGELRMTIKRTFPAGQPTPKGKPSTDIGEFQYEVERSYIGRMEKIGDLLGFSGSIHDAHCHSDEDGTIGYFELIDTTIAKREAGEKIP
jgi:hypothetical protein